MGVRLSDFASRLIQGRGLIRKNKGPSIVPLMIVRFMGYRVDPEAYWLSPPAGILLLTVCQRTASLSFQTDLTKFYSGVPYVGYTDWWNRSEVVSVRPPGAISTSRLLEINVELRGVSNHDNRQIW